MNRRKNDLNKKGTSVAEHCMLHSKQNVQQAGITLVALVVTIIVLLILAGVTISLALGDNGIIGKAQEASNMYANASKDEKKSLNDLSDEISRLSRRGDDEGGSGGGESQSGTPTGMKNASNNETIYKTESATGEVTPLSTTGTTTVKDNKNNEIKVPKNFGIAYDSGDNVADGVVIEDTNHNQYVWIPVGTITNSSGDSKTISLIRSNFNGTTTSNAEDAIYTYYTEYNSTSGASYGNTKAKSISEFVSSAKSNKGYYLARYEAGIEGTTDNFTNSPKADYTTVKPLSKSGVGVWNFIRQSEAATACQNMYNGVESDLVNSFAWDTAIDYIQKCGTATNSENYATTQGKSGTDTNNPQTTGTNTLLETSSTDQQCKIFDMAGNCYEWSTETYARSGTNRPCVNIGGCFSSNISTRNRSNYLTNNYNKEQGFRPILYI